MIEKLLNEYQKATKQLIKRKIPVRIADYWQCDPRPDTATLYIGCLMTGETVRCMPDYLDKTFVCKFDFEEIYPWMLAFLHEIGHIATYPELPQKFRTIRRQNCTPTQYRLQPIEYLADKWAVTFLNEHFTTALKIQAKLETLYANISLQELEQYIDSLA